ncbi:MAG: zinc metallopeptidase [bacterium]
MIFFYNTGYLIGTVLVLIAMVFSLMAQGKISNAYKKYSQIPSRANKTGAQIAREILNANGMADMPVFAVSGNLTDHFDPANYKINLSENVYNSTSIAAAAVAAHECGHAIQYHTGYKPLVIRNSIVPICNVGNYLGWFAVMIGLITSWTNLALFGFVLMLGILVFQIITLPVEFDASKRGLAILNHYYLASDEYAGAKTVLDSAALTYVAGTAATLASLLRILFLILGSRRR